MASECVSIWELGHGMTRLSHRLTAMQACLSAWHRSRASAEREGRSRQQVLLSFEVAAELAALGFSSALPYFAVGRTLPDSATHTPPSQIYKRVSACRFR